jgi:hypothetical protein
MTGRRRRIRAPGIASVLGIEHGERGAGLESGPSVGLGVDDRRLVAGPARQRRRNRKNCLCVRCLRGADHGESYHAAALLATEIRCKRPGCLVIFMSDNVQLSDTVVDTQEKPAQTADIPENHPALPAAPRHDAGVAVHLERLAETARTYARGAKAAATQRAYAADWRHYTAWCRRKDLEPLPPDPQVVGLYLAASASQTPAAGQKRSSVRPQSSPVISLRRRPPAKPISRMAPGRQTRRRQFSPTISCV